MKSVEHFRSMSLVPAMVYSWLWLQVVAPATGGTVMAAPAASQSPVGIASVASDYTYEINNASVIVTRYIGPGGDVSVPDTIEGLPVGGIGKLAFYGCDALTSVTLPDGVNFIGEAAFLACTRLTNIVIPNSVTRIETSAFQLCTSLPQVTIPDNLSSISMWLFASCSNLTRVALPQSVTAIMDGAFSDCTRLADIIIPNQVTNLAMWAFASCTSLENVILPENLTTIGEGAFSACTRLTHMTIPNHVSTIGNYAFGGCTRLLAIDVQPANSFFSSVDGVLLDQGQTALIAFPGGRSGAYSIPNQVTRIGQSAFEACRLLTDIVIPDSVVDIEITAFEYCTGLTKVTIPRGVTNLPRMAFASCTNLTRIYFQGNAPGLDLDVFRGVDHATVYYLPETSGWTAVFGGLPTALWEPRIISRGADFGIQGDSFGFAISWASDRTVVVEACTNLAHPIWLVVGTNTLTEGIAHFSDPNWNQYSARIYRLRSP